MPSAFHWITFSKWAEQYGENYSSFTRIPTITYGGDHRLGCPSPRCCRGKLYHSEFLPGSYRLAGEKVEHIFEQVRMLECPPVWDHANGPPCWDFVHRPHATMLQDLWVDFAYFRDELELNFSSDYQNWVRTLYSILSHNLTNHPHKRFSWDRDVLLMPYGEDFRAHRKLFQQGEFRSHIQSSQILLLTSDIVTYHPRIEFHPNNSQLHRPHEKKALVVFLNKLVETPEEWLTHIKQWVLFSRFFPAQDRARLA